MSKWAEECVSQAWESSHTQELDTNDLGWEKNPVWWGNQAGPEAAEYLWKWFLGIKIEYSNTKKTEDVLETSYIREG